MAHRGVLETIVGALAAAGLLAYGMYLASLGFNGTIGMAVVGGVVAIITGTGVHTIMRKRSPNGN